MHRYNIALIPTIHQSIFIQFAERFKDNAKIDYILGKSSIPHITLAQFYLNDKAASKKIWDDVHAKLKQISFRNLALQLQGLDCYFDTKRNDFVWLQLLPEFNPALHSLHHEIVHILGQHAISPINKALENYEPHLTLVHTSNFSHVENRENHRIHLTEIFYVGLGESDEIGQLTCLNEISKY